MSRVEALITPSVIKWARESAKFSLEEASKKLKRPAEDIEAWESGQLKPSIAQARKASEVYKRPLAVFYLPDPPKDFDTLRDYRRLPTSESREYDPKLALLMRTTVEHQEWARDFLLTEGIPELSFVGSVSINDSPIKVAEMILNELDITPDKQCNCRTRDDALLLWMRNAEKVGIFVFREGQINLNQCRGFVLSDKYAPFIYLNSEDARAAMLFTLVHELAHIWINQSGISNITAKGRYPSDDAANIETFCNKVASEALLYRKNFIAEWKKTKEKTLIEDRINNISKVFKVSEEAIARRLLEDNIIRHDKYLKLRVYYQDRWLEIKTNEKKQQRERQKKSGSGPTYYRMKVVNNGYAYTQTVVSAYNSGSITGKDASILLNAKINHIPKLALMAGHPQPIQPKS